jgi:threonine dehydrogenase-like Zn-dependent dehydrogenase
VTGRAPGGTSGCLGAEDRYREENPMKATVWKSPNNVQVEEVPDPQILNSQDAIVKITSTAICGSDLHLLQAYVPAMMPGDILGHEFMGEVVEVGPSVSKLKVGDRVVVPFPIACGVCFACQKGMYSVCENSNPNAWMAEKLWGHAGAGVFGYSHLTGGYAGGQAEYARVPFADVGPLKVPDGMTDEQVLFLSDILPTGYMGAEMCDIQPGDTIAVWGCGPVGQFAIASAFLLGAERVIAIDRFPYRLQMARDKAGAETLNYEEVDVIDALKEMTGGRGPDACIDAVGMEAHGHGPMFAFDRAMHAARMETDRPLALREAIKACRNGGTVSVIGAYGGYIDRFPIGSIMNRSLTIKSGQCHVQRYMQPLLEHIQNGDIDPTFIITHTMPLDQASHGYDIFKHKRDNCEKVILKA